jgi:hypothetical protein
MNESGIKKTFKPKKKNIICKRSAKINLLNITVQDRKTAAPETKMVSGETPVTHKSNKTLKNSKTVEIKRDTIVRITSCEARSPKSCFRVRTNCKKTLTKSPRVRNPRPT